MKQPDKEPWFLKDLPTAEPEPEKIEDPNQPQPEWEDLDHWDGNLEP